MMARTAKGIVMEVKRNYAVIMTGGGEFLKVKKTSPDISTGEEITSLVYNEKHIGFMKYGAIAAALLLMLIPFTYFQQANATVAYVNVDINPSLEMGINMYNKVTSAIPLNDDARKLLKNINLKGLNIEDAMGAVITEAKDMGYIDESKVNHIDIALIKLNEKNTNLSADALISNTEKKISEINVDATIKVQKASKEVHNEAKKENISTNKYLDMTGKDKDTLKVDIKKSVNADNEKSKGKENGGGKGNQSTDNSQSSKGNYNSDNGRKK